MRTQPTTLAAAAVTVLAAASLAFASPAHADSDVPIYALQTIADAVNAPEAQVLDNAAALVEGDGAGVAAVADLPDGAIVIPTDPARPILIGSDNPANADLEITLPASSAEATAVVHDSDVVTYNNGDASTTVVSALADGGVQLSTVITSADAPTRYNYGLNIPEGGYLLPDDSGAIYVVAPEGYIIATIAAAWAYDADGNPIPTHYEINANTLTQVVEHGPETAYPVVADPSYFFCTAFGWYPAVCVKYSKAETATISNIIKNGGGAGSAAFVAAFCGYIPFIPARALCAGVVAAGTWLNLGAVTTAAAQGKCVQYALTYPSIPGLLAVPLQVVKC